MTKSPVTQSPSPHIAQKHQALKWTQWKVQIIFWREKQIQIRKVVSNTSVLLKVILNVIFVLSLRYQGTERKKSCFVLQVFTKEDKRNHLFLEILLFFSNTLSCKPVVASNQVRWCTTAQVLSEWPRRATTLDKKKGRTFHKIFLHFSGLKKRENAKLSCSRSQN